VLKRGNRFHPEENRMRFEVKGVLTSAWNLEADT
jgi:hypothetical protein